MPHPVEISQGEHGLRPRQVLGQAAILHLGEAPQLLDHTECMLAAGARARTRPIDHAPAFAQRTPGGGSPVDSVAYAPRLEELSVGFFPVGLIAEHLSLLPVQQLRQLSDIGDRGIGRSHGMDDAVLISADVQLHPEMPVAALPGLFHLGVARPISIFGRTGRRDDGCVHDGPGAQQQAALFEQAANRSEDCAGQTMALQQMTKPQDSSLTGTTSSPNSTRAKRRIDSLS